MVDRRVVWATGAGGTVLRSMDGGRTWTHLAVPDAAALDFRSVQTLGGGSALVASAGEAEKGLARIFATADGGRHWHVAWSTDQKGVFLDALAFWDARTGVALSDPVGGTFVLMRTTDGGKTWSRIPPDRLPRTLPGEAAFAASGSILVAGNSNDMWIGTGGGVARVMRSGDRGATWSFTDAPVYAAAAAAGIFSLAFLDEARGIAVGGDYTQPRLAAPSVALTLDGGRSWHRAASPPAAYLSGVAWTGTDRHAVAVGLAGTFMTRDGGETWSQTDTVALNAVRCTRGTCVAVGPRGRIARMDDLR